MDLLQETVLKETDELNENNVSLRVSGRLEELPREARDAVKSAIEETASNTGLIVNLALNYSGRTEMIDAVRRIIEAGYGAEDVTGDLIDQHLYTAGLPDPDLLIRTSGEMRTSNFLIWQTAYTEFTFPEVLWPDFRRQHLYEAIDVYQSRQRRFGKTGDQLFAATHEQRSRAGEGNEHQREEPGCARWRGGRGDPDHPLRAADRRRLGARVRHGADGRRRVGVGRACRAAPDARSVRAHVGGSAGPF